ncbi:MAG: hypothetical protein ABSB59_41640 [Streptosporangiaceae bacterium]|jgi:hypothetical protein
MGVIAEAPAGTVAPDKPVRSAEAFEAALASGDGARVAACSQPPGTGGTSWR